MRHSIFGWSLPPGCSRLPGEEPEEPCAICHYPVDECTCPNCRVCGEQGNPNCINTHMKWDEFPHFKFIPSDKEAEQQQKEDEAMMTGLFGTEDITRADAP